MLYFVALIYYSNRGCAYITEEAFINIFLIEQRDDCTLHNLTNSIYYNRNWKFDLCEFMPLQNFVTNGKYDEENVVKCFLSI